MKPCWAWEGEAEGQGKGWNAGFLHLVDLESTFGDFWSTDYADASFGGGKI